MVFLELSLAWRVWIISRDLQPLSQSLFFNWLLLKIGLFSLWVCSVVLQSTGGVCLKRRWGAVLGWWGQWDGDGRTLGSTPTANASGNLTSSFAPVCYVMYGWWFVTIITMQPFTTLSLLPKYSPGRDKYLIIKKFIMKCINLYLSNDVIPYSQWKDASKFCGMLGQTLILWTRREK